MSEKPQLRALAKRVPERYIGQNHSRMPAMEHTVVTQLLLAIVGPYNFERVEVLRGGTKKNPDANVVTGVVARLTVEIDGKTVSVEDAGGLENAMNPDGDGERLKHCMSDALKRCAMRLGLGLHIWADNHYFLDELLARQTTEPEAETAPTPAPAPVQEQAEPETKDEGRPALDTGRREKIAQLVMDVQYEGGIEGFKKKALKGHEIASLTVPVADKVIGMLEGRKQEMLDQAAAEFDPEDVPGVSKGGAKAVPAKT